MIKLARVNNAGDLEAFFTLPFIELSYTILEFFVMLSIIIMSRR
jgi:hypothetical protein